MKYCSNCGNELHGERFCTKCGTKIDGTHEVPASPYISPQNNSSHKNKTGIIIVVLLAIAVVIGCAMFFLNNSASIVGTWEVSEQSKGESFSDYPEENFIIYDDGKFTCDGMNGTYSLSDDTVTFSFGLWGSLTYEYKVSRNELVLKNVEHDEDRAAIYYDRVTK